MRLEASGKQILSWRQKRFPALLLAMLCVLVWMAAGPVRALASESYRTEAAISGTVQFANAPFGSAQEAELTITSENGGAQIPLPADTTIRVKTSGSGAAAFSFGKMVYERPGNYAYVIRQTNLGAASYTYDTSVYYVTVQVSNKDDGGLAAEILASRDAKDAKTGEIAFRNSYSAGGNSDSGGGHSGGGGGGGSSRSSGSDRSYRPVTDDPPLEKKVTGEPPEDGFFTFMMSADRENEPMPEGSENGVKTASAYGPGSYEFGTITFTSPGDYSYTVREKVNGENYAYDSTVYNVTYHITAVGNTLQSRRVFTKASREQVDSLTFVNQYKGGTAAPDDTGSPDGGGLFRRLSPRTGDDSLLAWHAGLALISAALFLFLAMKRRKKSS